MKTLKGQWTMAESSVFVRKFRYVVILIALAITLIIVLLQSNYFQWHPPAAKNTAEPMIRAEEPMAMCLDYWEQMANAINNMYDLQCWASTVGITKVLEPVVRGIGHASVLRFSQQPNNLTNEYTFSNLIDINAWNKMSLRHSHATLVPLKTFLDNAVKKLVYVQTICAKCTTPCSSMSAIQKQGWYKFLTRKGFKVIDTVCINFKTESGISMTVESFRDRIFRKTGCNVSVVFPFWNGIRDHGNDRIRLKGSQCYAPLHRMTDIETAPTKPQKIIYAHANYSSPLVLSKPMYRYVDRFKREFMQGAQYVAVMLRSEKLKSSILKVSTKRMHCFNSIMSDWINMTTTVIMNNNTLFFSDIGKYGSATWGSREASNFAKIIQKSLHVKHPLSEVNQYLEKITGYKHAVFIAALQREIVAQARCAIIVGGGSFQKQTLNLFAHYHRGEELCYSFRNLSCESEYLSYICDDF